MKKINETNATESYLANLPAEQEVIVEVVLPSGFKILFAKPSKFTMLFKMGIVPQSGASSAVGKWIAAGLIKPTDFSSEQAATIDIGLELRNQVLLLSRKPKLVVGTPQSDDELSVSVLSDLDVEYLFAWIGAGGSAEKLLGKFPQRSEPRPLASAARPKQRDKAKRVSRA